MAPDALTDDEAERLLGAGIPGVCMVSSGTSHIAWLGPNDFLVLASDASAIAEKLRARDDMIATLTRFSRFDITREQLATGSSLCPEDGSAMSGLFGQVQVVLIAGDGRIALYAAPQYSQYISQFLEHFAP
ncbi:MAG: hypothetical protein V2J26_08115 [Pacificimonas sp.]|jgi:sarcosine oxidase gamma subunit|nr:hypothetical protein [Pacificimonas sp.]